MTTFHYEITPTNEQLWWMKYFEDLRLKYSTKKSAEAQRSGVLTG